MSAVDVTGGRNGINARNTGTQGLSIQVFGDVTGNGADGIYAYNSANDTTASMSIDMASGTTTYGLINGINALNNAGSLTITALGTSTGGANHGINARNYYNAANPGNLTITANNANGSVNAIDARNYSASALSITTTGPVIGANGYGVRAYNQSANPLTVTVGANSVVRGGAAGIFGSNPGSTITIGNSGYVSDLSGADSGLAITTTGGGATTVNNNATGSIGGRMNLSALNDTVNNFGLWTTEGTSNFDGGIDAVNNSGQTVTGNLAGGREITTLQNLETFNNTGLFTMSDQFAGSGLGLADNTNDQTFIPAGNWNGGGGSLLNLDAFLGAPGSQSDELHVNTTSGVTTINVVDTNAGPGAFNPTGILVVDANTSAAADFAVGSFTSVNGTAKIVNGNLVLDKGLFFYDLVFDAANANHLFVGVPDHEAFELTVLPTAAQDIWHNTTGIWLDRTADIRSIARFGGSTAFSFGPTADLAGPRSQPTSMGLGLWAKGVGAWTDRDNDNSFTLFNQTVNFNTSYDQDTYGILAGLDGGDETGDGGKVIFGFLAGYLSSKVEFDASPTTSEFYGATAGGYLTYLNGGLFVNALVKADLLNLRHRVPTLAAFAPSSAKTDATSIGVAVDGGYRVELSHGMFIEPQGTIAWVQSDIDGFTLGGAMVKPGKDDSLRVSGGMRIGSVVSDADGTRIEASVLGRAWAELQDQNNVSIVTAGLPLTLGDDIDQAYDLYGDVSGIVKIVKQGGSTFFVKAGVKFNGNFVTANAQGGFRLEF